MKACVPILITLIALLATGTGAEQAEVVDLTGTNYFARVHQELRSVTGSVDVAMYLMRLYPHSPTSSPTLVLVQDLVAAKKRGVMVRVLLDRSYRYGRGSATKAVDRKNETAAAILAEGGVAVSFTAPDTVLHEKVIILDGRKIISGSHNWSDAALRRDTEHSMLIESPQYALDRQEHFVSIPGEERLAIPSNDGTTAVPLGFITNRQLAPRMISSSDERAFDCYLFLLEQHDANEQTNDVMTVDYDDLAAALGLDRTMDRVAYRRQLTKTLRKLQKRYRLLTCEFRHGKPAEVALNRPGPAPVIRVPSELWRYGYMGKLSLAAKFAYLICLAEREKSDRGPSWRVSGPDMAERYSGTVDTIRRGLLELEQENLLRIIRSDVPPGKTFADRAPNLYALLPLLSDDEIREQWEELAEVHGKAELEQARGLALKLGRANNPEVVDNLARVIDRYGYAPTLKATEQVAAMVRDNPRRHVGYIVALIQNANEIEN